MDGWVAASIEDKVSFRNALIETLKMVELALSTPAHEHSVTPQLIKLQQALIYVEG